jgi:hypothetical protein
MVFVIRPPFTWTLLLFNSPAGEEPEVQGALDKAGLYGPQAIMQNLSLHLLLVFWYSMS